MSSMTSLWCNFHVCESCRTAMRIAPPAVNHRSVAASSLYFYLPSLLLLLLLLLDRHQRECLGCKNPIPVISQVSWEVCGHHLTDGVRGKHQVTTRHHNRSTALFRGPTGWARARRELLDFMVQGKINSGRHTDHPAGCHSIRTNQCPLPPSPIFFTGQMPFLPPNQQGQSTKGN